MHFGWIAVFIILVPPKTVDCCFSRMSELGDTLRAWMADDLNPVSNCV